MPLKRTNKTRERRSSQRFRIECDVRYRIVDVEEFGSGKTVDMSSSGILLTTDRVMSPECRVEVEVDWPVKLDNGAALKLVVMGRVVRSEKNDGALAGVKILRHTFQLASSRRVAAGNH